MWRGKMGEAVRWRVAQKQAGARGSESGVTMEVAGIDSERGQFLGKKELNLEI